MAKRRIDVELDNRDSSTDDESVGGGGVRFDRTLSSHVEKLLFPHGSSASSVAANASASAAAAGAVSSATLSGAKAVDGAGGDGLTTGGGEAGAFIAHAGASNSDGQLAVVGAVRVLGAARLCLLARASRICPLPVCLRVVVVVVFVCALTSSSRGANVLWHNDVAAILGAHALARRSALAAELRQHDIGGL